MKLIQLIIIIGLANICAFLIIAGNKNTYGIIVAIILIIIYLYICSIKGYDTGNKYSIYFIIASIPFPYLLQLLGNDAITITTIIIYLIFIINFFFLSIIKEIKINKPYYIIVLIIVYFLILTITLFINSSTLLGQSFRYYIANVSGIILFYLIINIIKNKSDIITILNIILITLTLQSVIATLQWIFPSIERFLLAFGTRLDAPKALIIDGISRSTGTIWDYELLAEWFLFGSIMSLGLIYETKKNIYYFSLLSCITGIIFTVTRSDLILLVIAITVILLLLKLLKYGEKNTTFKLVTRLVIASVAIYGIFNHQFNQLGERFQIYFNHSSIISIEAINRKAIWEMASEVFLKDKSLFGKGFVNVDSIYSGAVSFHSLYLTILYKFGIAGLLIHIIIWLRILYDGLRVIKKRAMSKKLYLVLFLLISFIFMLIDETKIEYLRYGHTIQFAWMVLALLVISIKQDNNY